MTAEWPRGCVLSERLAVSLSRQALPAGWRVTMAGVAEALSGKGIQEYWALSLNTGWTTLRLSRESPAGSGRFER